MSNHVQELSRVSPWKSQAEAQYEAFAGRLSVKGRAALTRHDEQCEADTTLRYGELWKRLAGGLGALAPHASEMSGQQAVKFHIPDGKYRQQVFALEDMKDGSIVVYMPDVVARAIEKKILAPGSANRMYKVSGDGETQIHLELINAETRDITVCKAMLGWGKCAVRASLAAGAREKQVRIVELLCELAAEAWAAPRP